MHDAQGSFLPTASELPPTLSKKGFASLVGVTAGRVSQMISAGLPVEPNGRIDAEKGRAWMRSNIDPNRRRANIDPRPYDSILASPMTPRAARDVAEAEIARLKAERMAGRLIDRRGALRAIEGRAKLERDGWIAWVNRIAPLLASETASDLAQITAFLDREIRAQLGVLASTPLELK